MKYERSGKIFRKEFIAKLERNFNNLQHDGYIRLFDYDLGGKENGKINIINQNAEKYF